MAYADKVTSEYRRLKSALTRATNSGDPLKVLAVCREAVRSFEEHGYPDDWMRFRRAAEDAQIAFAIEVEELML